MKYCLIWILGIISLSSCFNTNKKIPYKTLVPLIYELSINEEYFKSYLPEKDSITKMKNFIFYIDIKTLEKYRVSKENFQSTLNYYYENPKQFKGLIDSVISYADHQSQLCLNKKVDKLKAKKNSKLKKN
ncbi:MAG: DUF4296 domain-containing protein [Alphaproteobacteria bacterium]|nr:DUF4296 domain-containing protein [Alphaproteobacteria bacterium]